MMLMKMEINKIWKPRIMLIIAAAGILFGFMFLSFPLNYFPNGPNCEQQYKLMQDWTKEYGTEMDEAEYKNALQELKNRLGAPEEAADGSALLTYAGRSEDEYLQQWAGALVEYEMRYEKLKNESGEDTYTDTERVRVEDIIKNEKLNGILPYEIMGNVTEYWRWVSVFIILSVMILLAPNAVNDALTDVRKLQYASKYGRKILKTQFFAALMSAVGIVVLEIIICAVLYIRLGTLYFWDNPINSFFYGDIYWFDLSYGQYLLCILLLIVLFAAGAAGISFSLSCFSRNYISLMLKIIPAFLLLGMLSNNCISYLFEFNNMPYRLTKIKGAEMYIGVIVLLTGALLSFIALKHKSAVMDDDTAI